MVSTPKEVLASLCREVFDFLVLNPSSTVAEIHILTDLPMKQIAGAIDSLRRRGLVDRKKIANTGHGHGIHKYVYTYWTTTKDYKVDKRGRKPGVKTITKPKKVSVPKEWEVNTTTELLKPSQAEFIELPITITIRLPIAQLREVLR